MENGTIIMDVRYYIHLMDRHGTITMEVRDHPSDD